MMYAFRSSMSSALGQSELSGVRVLIVEDDEDAREIYRELFELCGGKTVTASSGRTGWERFQASRPDVVISDIQMPDGDGYELIHRVRALAVEAGRLTPAIAVSGSESTERCLEAGFDAHLSKPVDPLALVDVVRGFVRESNTTRSRWTLSGTDPAIALLTFVGHPTADDMRAATHSLAAMLDLHARHVVVDIRRITGFDISVGSVATRTVWEIRRHITGATIVGGSHAARLVAKAACAMLGVSCDLVEQWRSP